VWPSAPVLLLVTIAVEGGEEGTRERVMSGCRAALGSSACTEAGAPGAEQEPLSALVRVEEAAVVVSVQGNDAEPATRRLEFAAEDSAEQRGIAAGVLVAALAADLERSAAAGAPEPAPVRPPPAPEPEPPEPSDIRAPEVTEPRRRVWLLDVGAYGTAPLGALSVHLGGQAEVGFFVLPRLALLAGARGDTALSGGLDASRLGLSLGAGFELLPRAHGLSLLAIGQGRIEELQLGGGLSEPLDASVLRGGGALSLRLGFPTLGAGFYAGLEGALIGPAVAVYVGTEPQGEVPLASFSLLFGGRLASLRP